MFDSMVPDDFPALECYIEKLPPNMGKTPTKWPYPLISTLLTYFGEQDKSSVRVEDITLRIRKPEFFSGSAPNIYGIVSLSLSCLQSSVCPSMNLGTFLTSLIM